MSRNSRKKQKTKAEEVKEASQGLRGSIRSELESESDHLTSESAQLIKFHGVYQYDDRDQRRRLLQEGEGKAYRFMVRTRVPGGGRISPEQWLTLDRASQLYGNGTLRLTNRQDIQFHGVGKKNLASLIRLINQELLTTFGACGDGVRNVIACPVSSLAEDSVFDGQAWANAISRSLAFKTTAYMEIWLDGEKIESVFDEPLYGKGYLPRKFKIGISGVNENCPDVYTNDIGLVPVVERGSLTAFEVLVGGGLGSSHGNHQTYPRLATPLCRTDPEQLLPLLRAIVELYRDLGDRTDRKHARLKYVIEEMGIEAFRRSVEALLQTKLEPPRPVVFQGRSRHLGWQRQKEGRFYLGLFAENGRIHDSGPRLKSALREIVERFRPSIQLTPDQNLILADIEADKRAEITFVLESYQVSLPDAVSNLRLRSMACPALPTCGLALAEAERQLPGVISELERFGCGDAAVTIRMAGCPNSCSRPPVAEIGLVGRSSNGYHIYLGGSPTGQRLAELYRENVAAEELAVVIAGLIDLWRRETQEKESFGDWSHRIGVENLRQLALVPPAAVDKHSRHSGPSADY